MLCRVPKPAAGCTLVCARRVSSQQPVAPVKGEEEAPELEDFLVSVPPRTVRPVYASAPPLGSFKPDPARAVGRVQLPSELKNAQEGQSGG